jgi:probable HAF family extracellular repeat protein
MPRTLLSAVLSLSVLFSTLVAAQDASYTFTTIDVPGTTDAQVYGINAAGQIVGWSRDATEHSHSFVTDGVIFTPLNVPGATDTEANGINDRGQVVGVFADATGVHGFLTSDGVTFTTIDVPGASITEPHGINDRGQVMGGFGFTGAEGGHSFLTDGVTFTTFDIPVPGTIGTASWGIKAAGQIVGVFDDATGHIHAFIATPTQPKSQ